MNDIEDATSTSTPYASQLSGVAVKQIQWFLIKKADSLAGLSNINASPSSMITKSLSSHSNSIFE